MSTNDEIRKAAQAIVHDIETLTRCWIEKSEEDKAVEIVMLSIAKHLAPHPAQQGEDGPRDLLGLKRYDFEPGDICGYHCCSRIVENRTGEYLLFDDVFKLLNSHPSRARSHSKQEGGA